VVAALLLVLGMATACSNASDNGSATDGTDTTAGEQGAASDITIAATGDPTTGGSIAYGIEAETDGFDPTANRWAISGHMVAQAVFDPLASLDADGVAQPYLAESFEPNDDYTEWTVTLRSGVTFHNGEPLTSAAAVATLQAHQESFLTGSALAPVDEVTAVDDLTFTITSTQPWVALPAALTSQVGYVVSPAMVDPATAEAASRNPVGTGPFAQAEWIPNQRWVGERNEDYWRDGLPYLDRIEFRPIPAARSRFNAFTTGELQMMHTSSPDLIGELRAAANAGSIQLVEDRGEGEESFVLLNLEREPLDDVRVRQAIAFATDTETFNEVINSGNSEVARGPFTPASPWVVDTDYPEYDPERARELVEEYVADPDTPSSVRFTLSTTPTPETRQAAETLQEQWRQVGIEVDITTVDQSAFISTAVQGEYDANLWRQFGAPDPDSDYVWWHSGGEEGNILNFPNMFDDAIDEALERGRQSPDLADRKQAYADFQQRLAEVIPYIWLNHTMWVVAADNNVRDIGNGTLPDGQAAYPLGGVGTFAGVHRLTQTWIEQ